MQIVKTQRPSFLDRFSGKRSVISKQGPADLFQIEMLSTQKRKNTQSQNYKNKKISSVKTEQKEISNRKLISQSPQLQKNFQIKCGTDNVRMKSEISIKRNGSLPNIHKSVMKSDIVRRKSIQPLQQLQKRNQSKFQQIINSIDKQTDLVFRQKLKFDKVAMRHYQFLNKFQRKTILKDIREKRANKIS